MEIFAAPTPPYGLRTRRVSKNKYSCTLEDFDVEEYVIPITMSILHLPEEVMIMIIRLLDIQSQHNVYKVNNHFKNLVTMCNLNMSKVIVSRRFKDFFQQHFNVKPEIITEWVCQELGGNVAIMIWNTELTVFDNNFYQNLFDQLKQYFPYHVASACSERQIPENNDWFYTKPSQHDFTRLERKLQPTIKRRRLAPQDVILNYDSVCKEKKKMQSLSQCRYLENVYLVNETSDPQNLPEPKEMFRRKDILSHWKKRNSEARPGLTAGFAAPMYSHNSHRMLRQPRASLITAAKPPVRYRLSVHRPPHILPCVLRAGPPPRRYWLAAAVRAQRPSSTSGATCRDSGGAGRGRDASRTVLSRPHRLRTAAPLGRRSAQPDANERERTEQTHAYDTL
ncbi:hypothetical protein MSG28_010954 [Choristoneura fumiferana]|uniref:Uncharacterized protein n=1 Tax=Choristoneura fumiferana TaxID=7141 RepID=A0ACC0KPS6_CHOFU|nr:hypothetical protein MSG28_010954 [Choristoneura fumiferana]